MIVRIRFQSGPKVTQARRKNRHVALALAALLTPALLTVAALGFWRIASDLGVAGAFAIKQGLFSHWQVWFAAAVAIQFVIVVLNRYGNDRPLFRQTQPKDDAILDSGL